MDSLKLLPIFVLLILFCDPVSVSKADEPIDEEKLVFKVEAHEKGALLYLDDDKILFEGVPWEGCSEFPAQVLSLIGNMVMQGRKGSGNFKGTTSDLKWLQDNKSKTPHVAFSIEAQSSFSFRLILAKLFKAESLYFSVLPSAPR